MIIFVDIIVFTQDGIHFILDGIIKSMDKKIINLFFIYLCLDQPPSLPPHAAEGIPHHSPLYEDMGELDPVSQLCHIYWGVLTLIH